MLRVLGLLLVSTWVFAAEPAPPPFDAGASVQSTLTNVSSIIGSPQAVQDNLANPMLGSGPMKAFDGTEFNASIGCKSSLSFMQMVATPSASGDISQLNITQDIDLDGSPDRLYSPPLPISGACGNGLISCDVGTWDNCRYFAWQATDDLGIVLNEVNQRQLGGCYCINNHCGNGLYVGNMERILGDLGGGAAATLAAKDANLAISRTISSGPVITFFGQKSADCTTATNGDLAQYFTNPQNLGTDAFNSAVTDANYQTLVNSPVAAQGDETMQTCTIERNVTVTEIALDDIIHFNQGTGSIGYCGADCIQLTLGQAGDNYWGGACDLKENSVSFDVLQPDLIKQAILTDSYFDDWIQVRARGQVVWSGPYNNWNDNPIQFNGQYPKLPGGCELGTSWHQTPNLDFTAQIKQAGPIEFSTHVVVAGNGEGFTTAKILVDTRCEANEDEIYDHCASLRDDANCTLVNEKVDNVETYDNYANTGLTPLSSTVNVPGTSCSVPVTRDWWKKERTYRCLNNPRYTFDNALDRVDTVQTSLSSGAFNDTRTQVDGSVTQAAMALSLPDMPEVPACELACKTRKPRTAVDAAEYGVVADQRSSPTVYDYFYHGCPQSTCPIGAGESLVKDCSCIDEFQEVTATMQTMRLAGQDILCTTGTQTPAPTAPTAP